MRNNLKLADWKCLLNGVVCYVDSKINRIVYAYDKDDGVIISNCSYLEFLNLFYKRIDASNTDYMASSLLTWIDNVPIDSISAFSVINNKGEELGFQIHKKQGGGKNEFFIYIENSNPNEKILNFIDFLTKVYQKEAIISTIKRELAKDKPKPFYLVMIDIDNFKKINDTYGHLFGDVILSAFSSILKKVFTNGYVGRFGGDEFLVICYDSLDFQDVWNKLHDLYEQAQRYSLGVDSSTSIKYTFGCSKVNCPGAVNVTFTIGCARYGIDGSDYQTLFNNADRALYRGKKKGKNCFIIFRKEAHLGIDLNGIDSFGNDAIDANDYDKVHFCTKIMTILSRNLDLKQISRML